jgi:multidrug efflux pump subunit AcrB
MSIVKNIINKAKSDDYDQDTQLTREQDTQVTSNQDTQLPSKQVKKSVKKKTLNLEVPAEVGNFWMGKIKMEGSQFKKIVIAFLSKKYGLPEGYTKDDL